jgi:hypothetical protein
MCNGNSLLTTSSVQKRSWTLNQRNRRDRSRTPVVSAAVREVAADGKVDSCRGFGTFSFSGTEGAHDENQSASRDEDELCATDESPGEMEIRPLF